MKVFKFLRYSFVKTKCLNNFYYNKPREHNNTLSRREKIFLKFNLPAAVQASACESLLSKMSNSNIFFPSDQVDE